MIVELFGLPATGKSSFAGILEKEGYTRITVSSKVAIVFWNLLFMFFHPISFFGIFFVLLKISNSFVVFRFNFFNGFLHRNAKWQKALFTRRERVLIDEGHFQNILSFFSTEASDTGIKNIIKYTKKPDMLYILTLDEVEREKRLAMRAKNSRSELGEEYFTLWSRVVKLNSERTIKIIKELVLPHKVIEGK